MPKREDEYWAGTKEPRGRPLCPFCGSAKVYQRYTQPGGWWRCDNCGRNFPSPSYGPGEDFGKEARWFGKTTEKNLRGKLTEAGEGRKQTKLKHSSGEVRPLRPNIATLAIWILVAIAVFLGVLLWQKSEELGRAKLQLNETQQTVTTLQTQLSQSQQTIANLQRQLRESQTNEKALSTQLSQAKHTVAKLQAELTELKSPPLIPSKPVTISGDLPGDRVVSIPIELNRFEKVQGEIRATGISPIVAYIQDPAGKMVRDFGQIWQSNFLFTAQIDGRYTVVIRNPVGVLRSYSLRYTIFRRQAGK